MTSGEKINYVWLSSFQLCTMQTLSTKYNQLTDYYILQGFNVRLKLYM